jgi:hypothetical protein
MTCSRGCCATQAEHYRSISVGRSDVLAEGKTTVDDHGTHTVEVKESGADRQDVTVKVPTVAVTTTTREVP